MDWYRAYHGMPQDAKLKVVAHRAKQPVASVLAVWVYLLDMASQSRPRGNVVIDAEQIAVLQNLETDDVTKIIQGFYEKAMITPENRLTNWDKRQYTTSTERSKKSRAKAQRHATPRNAAQQEATPSDAVRRQKPQKQTEYREQKTDIRNTEDRSAEVRSAEVRVAEARSTEVRSAEAEQKPDSDKKQKTHTEKREREREKQKIGGKLSNQNQSEIKNENQTENQNQTKNQNQNESQTEHEILQQMLGIWNEEVQCKLTRGQQAILTTRRKEQMARRWREDFQQDIRAWRYYCEIIGASNFCLGQREGKEGKAWTIDLGWAVASSDHVARIMEGGFSGGNHPPKPPSCDVPALQPAWDQVLAAFNRKYGKPTYRSWLAATAVTRMTRKGDDVVVTLRCPNRFIQNWIRDHYLADMTRWWQEASAKETGVMRVELTVEG